MLQKTLLTLILAVTIPGMATAQWAAYSLPEQYFPTNHLLSHNGTLYASGNAGVYYSTDDGLTWNKYNLAGGGASSMRELIFAGSDMYVRTTTEGVLSSDDNGATWKTDTAGLKGQMDIIAIHYDGTNVWVSGKYPNYGLWYKKPADASWTKVSNGNMGASNNPITGIANDGSTLYVSTMNNFYTSTDAGQTWNTATATGYPTGVELGYAGRGLTIIGSDIIYASHSGLHRSSDGGDSWTDITGSNFPLFFGGRSVAYFLYANNTMYAATRKDSVFMSTDNGANWTAISDGHLGDFSTSLAYHNGILLASHFGKDSIYSNGTVTAVQPGSTEQEISVYPNPASAEINITMPDAGAQSLNVYDLCGKEVISMTPVMAGKNLRLDVSSLPKGIYILGITAADQRYSTKISIR